MMKKDVVLVIASREGVVDLKALHSALKDERIKAVALETGKEEFEKRKKLMEHSNVYPTPYLGNVTREAYERAGEDVLAVLKEFFNV